MKSVSGMEMCKVLERNGWVLKRTKSSHHIYAHPKFPGTIIIIPVHGHLALKTGTQRSIMRDAGLAEQDLC